MKMFVKRMTFAFALAAATAAGAGGSPGRFTFISPAGEWKGEELKHDETAAAFSRSVANAADVSRVEAVGCLKAE